MIKVLVQVSGGSTDRRIYNEQTLEYQGTRRGHHPYPYPYGFILGTRAEDDACLDCYVITHDDLPAGSPWNVSLLVCSNNWKVMKWIIRFWQLS